LIGSGLFYLTCTLGRALISIPMLECRPSERQQGARQTPILTESHVPMTASRAESILGLCIANNSISRPPHLLQRGKRLPEQHRQPIAGTHAQHRKEDADNGQAGPRVHAIPPARRCAHTRTCTALTDRFWPRMSCSKPRKPLQFSAWGFDDMDESAGSSSLPQPWPGSRAFWSLRLGI
jgi:hypothetical protein